MIKSFVSSMTARIFLILVGGTIASGALVMTLAAYERKDLDAQIRTRHMAERVEQLILMLDAVPALARKPIADISSKYGIRVEFSQAITVIDTVPDSEFTTELKAALGKYRYINVLESDSSNCPVRKPVINAPIQAPPQCEAILTSLKDGTPVSLYVTHRNPPPPPFRGNFIRNLLLFLSGLTLITLVIAHMATKPLRRLAQAAHDLSRNIEHQPLPENAGPREVREASAAFNSMQHSIRSYIEERSCMLAAIAHDLQTPLTRLRLRLEKVDDKQLRANLVSDLTATQDMVREGLEFANTLNADESRELVDLDSLVEAVCHDAIDAGCDVTYNGKIGKSISASPHALRRCIANLLDNAVKYGKFAHVEVKLEGSRTIICIIDGGTGIPEDQLETVFQPFNRLENSRSRSSGGTGLGLTIARIIANKYNGSITLRNIREVGLGLEVKLELPL